MSGSEASNTSLDHAWKGKPNIKQIVYRLS